MVSATSLKVLGPSGRHVRRGFAMNSWASLVAALQAHLLVDCLEPLGVHNLLRVIEATYKPMSAQWLPLIGPSETTSLSACRFLFGHLGLSHIGITRQHTMNTAHQVFDICTLQRTNFYTSHHTTCLLVPALQQNSPPPQPDGTLLGGVLFHPLIWEVKHSQGVGLPQC